MNFKKMSILILVLTFMSFSLPKNIQKKVDKEIKSAFNIESFVFEAKKIEPEIASTLPSNFGSDHFFSIKNNNTLLGYAYVSKAPSKTDEFDYLVLLDSNLIVKKAKVLVYREDYGGEIGSKRWLSQFVGKTKNDALRYNDTVVAISGATISVRSMTTAMNNLLQSLKILNDKGIL